ncbi:MAG: peptidoglycan-binding domain-containing protein [Limisphaerales bacterium]
MNKLLMGIFAAGTVFVVNVALAAGHGGHGGGFAGSPGAAGAGGGRVYTPTAPRFPGVGAEHFVGRPYGVFPRAGITQYPSTGTSARPNVTTGKQPNRYPSTGTSTRPNVTIGKQPNQRQSSWSHNPQTRKSRLDPQTAAKLRHWPGKRDNSAQANEEHREHKLHHHDRDWWRHHCAAIVFFDWGYWGWEDGWWFPAWGYDPYYSYYAYDGPIYGYDGLPPDQVVADVQGALQRLGYYQGAIDGVLGPATQDAIENYQRDHGLPVTGGIDARTLASMGFTQ